MGSDHVVLTFFNLKTEEARIFTVKALSFYPATFSAQGLQFLRGLTHGCLLGFFFSSYCFFSFNHSHQNGCEVVTVTLLWTPESQSHVKKGSASHSSLPQANSTA